MLEFRPKAAFITGACTGYASGLRMPKHMFRRSQKTAPQVVFWDLCRLRVLVCFTPPVKVADMYASTRLLCAEKSNMFEIFILTRF